MKTLFKFTCAEHQEYGGLGWRIANMPAFDPLGGMGVAHDILEHWPNDDSTTGELMALGASMVVRDFDRYYRERGQYAPSPARNFSGEIAELLLKIDSGEWVPLRPIKRLILPSDIRALAEIRYAVQHIHRHFSGESGDYDGPYRMDLVTEAHVRSWLATGFNRALRRYKDTDRYNLLRAFQHIEKQADLALMDAYEGAEMTVRVMWGEDLRPETIKVEYDF
jgi:hypothetical protein